MEKKAKAEAKRVRRNNRKQAGDADDAAEPSDVEDNTPVDEPDTSRSVDDPT